MLNLVRSVSKPFQFSIKEAFFETKQWTFSVKLYKLKLFKLFKVLQGWYFFWKKRNEFIDFNYWFQFQWSQLIFNLLVLNEKNYSNIRVCCRIEADDYFLILDMRDIWISHKVNVWVRYWSVSRNYHLFLFARQCLSMPLQFTLHCLCYISHYHFSVSIPSQNQDLRDLWRHILYDEIIASEMLFVFSLSSVSSRE